MSNSDARQLYSSLKSQPDLLEALRTRALNDFYFFCKAVMNYKDMTPHCHKKMCDFIVNETWKRKMTLQPRGHLKSAILTIAHSLWLGTKDPYESVLILNESSENAEEFLYKIRKTVVENPIYRALFPECVPDESSKDVRWSNKFADLKRKPGGFYIGPTFQAIGIRGAPTSRHVTRIKFDDVYGESAANSEADSEYIWRAYAKSDNLLVSPKDNFIDLIGTHWNTFDVYVRIMEEEGGCFLDQSGEQVAWLSQPSPTYLIWRRSCYEEDGITPIWGERFTEAVLEQERKKLGPFMFALQMLNNPVAESNVDFTAKDVRFWEHDRLDDKRIRFFDPVANSWSPTYHDNEADWIQVLDPAVGMKPTHSNTGIVAMAQYPGGQIAIRRIFKGKARKATTDKKGWLDRLYTNNNDFPIRTTYFEAVGYQKVIGKEDIMDRNFTEPNPIYAEEIKMGFRALSKPVRIRNVIQPALVSNRLYVHKSMTPLLDEIRVHPMGKDPALLDCIAHGIPRLQAPLTEEEDKELARLNREQEESMGAHTGYGFDYGDIYVNE